MTRGQKHVENKFMILSFAQNKGDYILSFAVVVQSLLVIFQQCLIGVLHMSPENTTIYRVVLSAIPILCAMYYICRRKKMLFIATYVFTFFVLLVHSLIFPDNVLYLKQSVGRFLLPILLPIFLAVASIRNFQILIDTLYFVSWCTFVLALIYVAMFFTGDSVFESYNMGFSYGLLIPTLSLYIRKNFWSVVASFVMFLIIVALGSRGAAFIIVMYFIYDLFICNKKHFSLFVAVGIGGYLLLPLFVELLANLGITSRTLLLLLSGDINSDSGRSYLYQRCFESLIQSPIIGLGLFGDRVILSGIYCHNFLLEIAINFGIPIAITLIMWLFLQVTIRYFYCKPANRSFLVIIVLAVLVKLLVSGSYLEDYDLAFLLGVLYRGDTDLVTNKNNSI